MSDPFVYVTMVTTLIPYSLLFKLNLGIHLSKALMSSMVDLCENVNEYKVPSMSTNANSQIRVSCVIFNSCEYTNEFGLDSYKSVVCRTQISHSIEESKIYGN